MRSVGIKELKNKLSEYVRVAASGEPVQVTDRGTVVAALVPAKQKKVARTQAAIWAELVREGVVTPAKNPSRAPPPKPPPIMTRKQLLEELARDREDR